MQTPNRNQSDDTNNPPIIEMSAEAQFFGKDIFGVKDKEVGKTITYLSANTLGEARDILSPSRQEPDPQHLIDSLQRTGEIPQSVHTDKLTALLRILQKIGVNLRINGKKLQSTDSVGVEIPVTTFGLQRLLNLGSRLSTFILPLAISGQAAAQEFLKPGQNLSDTLQKVETVSQEPSQLQNILDSINTGATADVLLALLVILGGTIVIKKVLRRSKNRSIKKTIVPLDAETEHKPTKKTKARKENAKLISVLKTRLSKERSLHFDIDLDIDIKLDNPDAINPEALKNTLHNLDLALHELIKEAGLASQSSLTNSIISICSTPEEANRVLANREKISTIPILISSSKEDIIEALKKGIEHIEKSSTIRWWEQDISATRSAPTDRPIEEHNDREAIGLNVEILVDDSINKGNINDILYGIERELDYMPLQDKATIDNTTILLTNNPSDLSIKVRETDGKVIIPILISDDLSDIHEQLSRQLQSIREQNLEKKIERPDQVTDRTRKMIKVNLLPPRAKEAARKLDRWDKRAGRATWSGTKTLGRGLGHVTGIGAATAAKAITTGASKAVEIPERLKHRSKVKAIVKQLKNKGQPLSLPQGMSTPERKMLVLDALIKEIQDLHIPRFEIKKEIETTDEDWPISFETLSEEEANKIANLKLKTIILKITSITEPVAKALAKCKCDWLILPDLENIDKASARALYPIKDKIESPIADDIEPPLDFDDPQPLDELKIDDELEDANNKIAPLSVSIREERLGLHVKNKILKGIHALPIACAKLRQSDREVLEAQKIVIGDIHGSGILVITNSNLATLTQHEFIVEIPYDVTPEEMLTNLEKAVVEIREKQEEGRVWQETERVRQRNEAIVEKMETTGSYIHDSTNGHLTTEIANLILNTKSKQNDKPICDITVDEIQIPAAARTLTEIQSNNLILDISHLTPDIAEILAEFPGRQLDIITRELDVETARALAGFNGRYLRITTGSSEAISDEVLKELSKSRCGKVEITELTADNRLHAMIEEDETEAYETMIERNRMLEATRIIENSVNVKGVSVDTWPVKYDKIEELLTSEKIAEIGAAIKETLAELSRTDLEAFETRNPRIMLAEKDDKHRPDRGEINRGKGFYIDLNVTGNKETIKRKLRQLLSEDRLERISLLEPQADEPHLTDDHFEPPTPLAPTAQSPAVQAMSLGTAPDEPTEPESTPDDTLESDVTELTEAQVKRLITFKGKHIRLPNLNTIDEMIAETLAKFPGESITVNLSHREDLRGLRKLAEFKGNLIFIFPDCANAVEIETLRGR